MQERIGGKTAGGPRRLAAAVDPVPVLLQLDKAAFGFLCQAVLGIDYAHAAQQLGNGLPVVFLDFPEGGSQCADALPGMVSDIRGQQFCCTGTVFCLDAVGNSPVVVPPELAAQAQRIIDAAKILLSPVDMGHPGLEIPPHQGEAATVDRPVPGEEATRLPQPLDHLLHIRVAGENTGHINGEAVKKRGE